MTLNKNPYKGCRDLFPVEKRLQNYLFQKMREAAEAFAYGPYDGPLLEEVDLYRAKSGEELINEQIYSFIDRGGREVAIRPEMTPTLARMVSQVHREWAKPIRLYSIPNLMRYEKPQKGRLREHWQFNCDIFGAPDRLGEVEILQVAVHLMKSLGASAEHFEIMFNDRNVINAFFDKILGLTAEQSHKLYKIIDKAKKVPPEALDKMIAELGAGPNTEKELKRYLSFEEFSQVVDYFNEKGLSEAAQEFSALVGKLEKIGLKDYVHFDPTIVRGLDYYTGVVFEIFDKNPENRRAICGGGAYGNLLQIFNEPALAGVGFGMGDVTLTDFLRTHQLLPNFETQDIDLLLSYQCTEAEEKALSLGQKLRERKFNVSMQLGVSKIAKIFPLAEKQGASFVGIIGEDEVKKEIVQIKNMKTKEQLSFSWTQLDELAQHLRKK